MEVQMERSNRIESIFIFPRRLGKYGYSINHGRRYGADYDSILKMISLLIRHENLTELEELLLTYQYILIFPGAITEVSRLNIE